MRTSKNPIQIRKKNIREINLPSEVFLREKKIKRNDEHFNYTGLEEINIK